MSEELATSVDFYTLIVWVQFSEISTELDNGNPKINMTKNTQMSLCNMHWDQNTKCSSKSHKQNHSMYTQRRVQPEQCYFTVQITGINFECSL